MTIAAGFIYKDGILLCSDTQQEGGAITIHGPTIGAFNCPAGKLAFAFAGNVRFAICAIQACEQALRIADAKDTIDTLRETLEFEYNRLVYRHPDYKTDYSAVAYSLLIAFWEEGSHRTSLFMTQHHALMSSFETFQAIGSGFELATVLARCFEHKQLSEKQVLILAAYVLARVRDNVPGCGGESQFIILRRDGEAEIVGHVRLGQIAHYAATYDRGAHELLFSMAGGTEEEFDEQVKDFCAIARMTRNFWQHFESLTQAERSFPLLTKDDPPRQQPSPEKPGGSDVS